MRISRIKINNFRNFEEFDVAVGESAVIVGENGVGWEQHVAAIFSNLLTATGAGARFLPPRLLQKN
jgi:predicted ATP-binding protein involved in virulence